MLRLRNKTNGAVMVVGETIAAQLDMSQWEPDDSGDDDRQPETAP